MTKNLNSHFCYIILYKESMLADAIMTSGDTGKNFVLNYTKINGFDKALLATLPAYWYCLHLPRDRYELESAMPSDLQILHRLERPQRILLWKSGDQLDDDSLQYLLKCNPVLIISEDGLSGAASELRTALSIQLDVAFFSQLSQDSLSAHWRSIAGLYDLVDEPLAAIAPIIVDEVLHPFTSLSGSFIARRMDEAGYLENLKERDEVIDRIGEVFKLHTLVAALFRMEKEGLKREGNDAILHSFYDEEAELTQLPVTLISSGVSKSYERNAYGKSGSRISFDENKKIAWKSSQWSHDDATIEQYVTAIILNHRAIASSGVGLRVKDSTAEMFNLLDRLEGHCKEIEPKPTKVWKLLTQIGQEAANSIGEAGQILLRRASRLTIFSDFPIGLAIFPGDTTPIMLSVPTTYRPLTPLAVSLQMEMWPPSPSYWGKGLRILVAECLDIKDKIYKTSARAWKQIQKILEPVNNISFTVAQIGSLDELNAILEKTNYDLLLISAHGFYEREKNTAGIVIGKERHLDIKLKNMPRLIILSSCHVSPRGVNAVSIADILMRRGATAVIGTLIPINVYRNAQFMLRFFANLRLAITGEMTFSSLLELWTYVVYSNAFNDILSSSKDMRRWADSNYKGRSITQEFMLNRSKGRMRTNHIYDNTIEILREIAKETNFGEKFDSFLKSSGFFPETLFYQIIGWPEQIILKDKRLDNLPVRLTEDVPDPS